MTDRAGSSAPPRQEDEGEGGAASRAAFETAAAATAAAAELAVLLRQERATDELRDHLLLKRQWRDRRDGGRGSGPSGSPTSAASRRQQPLHNEVWREKVSEWCYRVVDHVGGSRDVVYGAMSLLDRFLAVEAAERRDGGGDEVRGRDEGRRGGGDYGGDRGGYQVAATTALLLAARLYDSAADPPLGAKDLLRAGRGGVRAEDISAAAERMVATLSWRHRVPAPAAFVRPLLRLLPLPAAASSDGGRDALLSDLLNDAMFFAEVSVCDSYFVGRSASAAALGAVRLAADSHPRLSSGEARDELRRAVRRASGLDADSVEVREVLHRLRAVCAREGPRGGGGGAAMPAPAPSGPGGAADVVPFEDEEVTPPLHKTSRVVSLDEMAVLERGRQRRGGASGAEAPPAKRARTAAVIEG